MQPALYGLGGWLMYFWIGLCLTPFINFGYALHNMRPLHGAIAVGVSVLCLVVAIRIYRYHPSAIDAMRILIIVELLHAFLIAVWLAYDLPHRNDVIGNAGFRQVGMKMVRAAVMWLYFRESVRVRNTFGRNI